MYETIYLTLSRVGKSYVESEEFYVVKNGKLIKWKYKNLMIVY